MKDFEPPRAARVFNASPTPSVSMKILFTNDLHGSPGYLSRIFTVLKAARRSDEALILDAGDPGSTQEWIKLWFQRVGFAGSVLGNEGGVSVFPRRVLEHHPSGSVLTNAGPKVQGIPRWRIVSKGSMRVGIFGLIPQYPYGPENDNPLLTDPVRASKEAVTALRGNVDLVVCISHLGLRSDIDLLERVDGIDICVSGHSHHRTTSPIVINGASLLQAGCNGAYVGVFEVGESPTGSPSVDAGYLLESWTASENGAMEAELYESAAGKLSGAGPDRPRSATPKMLAQLPREVGDPWQENRWANALTDVLRTAAGAAIGLLKANSILPLVPGGDFTQWDLAKCFPGLLLNELMGFDTVHVGAVTGAALRAAAEHAVDDLACDTHPHAPSDARLTSHNLLHTSGLEITYDLNRPVGERVAAVLADGRPLVDDRSYTVASDRFIAAGMSGFRMLADATEWEPFGHLREVVETGLSQLRDLPAVEGRLQYI